MRTLVQGGLVVRHDGVRRADVLLEDERIVEVGEGLSASGACVVDATDSLILIPPNNGMVNAVSQFSSSNRLSVNFSV